MFPDGIEEVLAALPVGVFLTDAMGQMTMATPLASEIAGLEPDAWRGRNVTELVAPEDVEEVLDHLAAGQDITVDDIGGPHTFRVTGTDGVNRSLEVWSRNRTTDGVIDGYALVVTHEATNRLLLDVVQGVAAGDPLADVAAGVARAMTALPVESEALVLTPGVDGELWPRTDIPDRCDEASLAMAREVWASGAAQHHEDLAGRGPAWCHPVAGGRHQATAAVVLLWPVTTIRPTLNQALHVERALAVLSLALTRDETLAELQRAATHDDLTGLLNRAGLHGRWTGRPDPATALLYVDLDGFKPINDALGHRAGDAVLVEVASRLRSVVRPEDDVVRLGGDEFAVICPGVGADRARAIAERLVEVVSAPVDLPGGPSVAVSASVGLTSAGRSLDDLVERADAALYEAKRTGGARVVVADPSTVGL